MRKVIVGAALAVTVLGAGGTCFAGEVTGGPNPKPTPVQTHLAASICSFSGKEDGLTLLGFDPVTGAPIIVPVATGPGLVQTPHMENSYGIIHPAGIPGEACRGNAEGEG